MTIIDVLLRSADMHREISGPFLLARRTYLTARERGNTHYCFYCGGNFGFTPGPQGEVLGSKDPICDLILPENDPEGRGTVDIRTALVTTRLGPFLSVESLGSRPKAGCEPSVYEDWLSKTAYFDYSDAFEAWAVSAGYRVSRPDAMFRHNALEHANGVVGGIQNYKHAMDWLVAELPEGFPFVVSLT